ncbi:MAG: hypothetical protein N2167_04420 [Flavobacteriales bacterium]|nr:hypothetical protein [Flavobacteriales bacterium]
MKRVVFSIAVFAAFLYACGGSGDCRTCTKTDNTTGTTINYEVTTCKNGNIITKTTIDGQTAIDTVEGPAQTDASLNAWVDVQEGQGWDCN